MKSVDGFVGVYLEKKKESNIKKKEKNFKNTNDHLVFLKEKKKKHKKEKKMRTRIWIATLSGMLLGILSHEYLAPKEVKEVIVNKTDTIYKVKYKPKVEYKYIEKPKQVVIYKTKIDTVLLRNISIDSLVSIDLNNKSINLTTINDSTIKEKLYTLDIDNFDYRYINGNLSYKRKSIFKNLRPYVDVKYKPIHNMMDLSTGIILKTTGIYYKLGINGFYYPKFSDKVNADLEFSITVNL